MILFSNIILRVPWLNRNRVKTNQIGQYTLKINSIILKVQKLSLSGEQNVAEGIFFLSASRQNRSSENRDASKNRLFFPPRLDFKR